MCFYLKRHFNNYLSGCSSGFPNDGGVGFTQQRLGKVWLLLQHLTRLIHPTAAERRGGGWGGGRSERFKNGRQGEGAEEIGRSKKSRQSLRGGRRGGLGQRDREMQGGVQRERKDRKWGRCRAEVERSNSGTEEKEVQRIPLCHHRDKYCK